MDKVFEQILRNTITKYENETEKMFIVTFKEIGERCNPTEIGSFEDRKCKWEVTIPTKRPKSWNEKVTVWRGVSEEKIEADHKANEEPIPTETELLALNGVYDSVVDIKNKITEIQLTNAVELFKNGDGDLESFRDVGKDDKGQTIWELTCGACKKTQTNAHVNCVCQTRYNDFTDSCYNRFADKSKKGYYDNRKNRYLIPHTFLDNIKVGDGTIYYTTGGSIGIITTLGKIIPVKN